MNKYDRMKHLLQHVEEVLSAYDHETGWPDDLRALLVEVIQENQDRRRNNPGRPPNRQLKTTPDERAEMVRLIQQENRTLTDVGQLFGVTREYVRQLVKASGGYSRTQIAEQQAQIRRVFNAVGLAAKLTHNQRHGTVRRYGMGCRCAPCVRANTAYRRKAYYGRSLEPDDPRHGTNNGYTNYRCRCDACKAVNSIAQAESRRRRLARKEAA